MEKVCHLLSAMLTKYEHVIISIETMATEKLINIEFVKARLLDAEIKESDDRNRQPSTAFLSCYRCGKAGHKAVQCRENKIHLQQINQNRKYRGMKHKNSKYRGRGTNYQKGQINNQCSNCTESKQDFLFITNDLVMATNSYSEGNINFIIDSGATQNLIMDLYEKYMHDVKLLNKEIKIYVTNIPHICVQIKLEI